MKEGVRLAALADALPVFKCSITGIFFFFVTSVTAIFTSGLCLILNSMHNFCYFQTTVFVQKCLYLRNATAAVPFQLSQQTCSLLQAIPKNVITILQIPNER